MQRGAAGSGTSGRRCAAQLELTGFWQSHDRLKAIRLLGRQPVEANDDRRIVTIFVASHALRPGGKTAFDDLLGDLQDTQQERYEKAVRERWPDLFGTREKEEWRQILLALADQNIERLNAKLEVHEQNADAQAERTFVRLSFDPSPEGEALRNYLIKCTNALFRGMATYRKYHTRTSGRWDGPSGAGPDGTRPHRSEDAGRAAYETDRSALGDHDSFGPGDGQDDRPERADVIDPEGVERHGDLTSGMGEIGENAPNEAKFDESMSRVEPQESIQVTANLGALSGLDDGAPEPAEGRTPEQGEAPTSSSESAGEVLGAGLRAPEGSPPSGRPKVSTSLTRQSNIARSLGSGFESGDPKPPAPSSSDRTSTRPCTIPGGRASRRATAHHGSDPPKADRGGSPSQDHETSVRGSSPVTVSQREQTQFRLEKERRAVERMVEEKLKAGCSSLTEILASALALPRSGSRDP